MEESKTKLKKLLIASVSLYLLAWVVGISVLKPYLFDFQYNELFFENPWIIWSLLFVVFMWIPVSLFLLGQGIFLRRRMNAEGYEGDRSICTLSIVIPFIFWIFYLLSRVVNLV
jgi:hypothetical protein